MRILQTPVRFAPDVGGVESYVYELSRRIRDRGHEVSVLCADTGAGRSDDVVDGIPVTRLPAPLSVANTNVTPTLPVALLRRVRSVDVVHAHLPTPWSADLSALAGAVTGTPVVLTYHNDIVGEGAADAVARLYNATALQLTLRLVDRILVTREGYVDRSAHLAPFAAKTVTVLNGVDVDRFRPTASGEQAVDDLGFAADRPTVFFLGVLDEYHDYKGCDDLLAAVKRLAARDSRTPRVVIGGDGPRREAYAATARDMGIEDHVRFPGYVPDEDLPAAYAAADVFVLPSTSDAQEGFGLAALEALACETPVVTTDVVGVASDVRRHDLGAVVPPGDPAALADGIESVLSGSPDVAAGRSLCVDRYAWETSADALLDEYEDVLEARS